MLVVPSAKIMISILSTQAKNMMLPDIVEYCIYELALPEILNTHILTSEAIPWHKSITAFLVLWDRPAAVCAHLP